MMYGDDEFPLDPIPMQPMPTIAEVLEVQATIEPPTKKKKGDDQIKPEDLEGMDAEEMLRLVATRHKEFQGRTFSKVMEIVGIGGKGTPHDVKWSKIRAVLEKVGIQVTVDGVAPPPLTAVPENLSHLIDTELPGWLVEHAAKFDGVPTIAITESTGMLAPDLLKLRTEFWARFGEALVVYYPKPEELATCNPVLVAHLRTYVFNQMAKGTKTPLLVLRPEPKPTATAASKKPTTINNRYLLSTPIHYSKHHLSNGLRLLAIVKKARTSEVRDEIKLFTNGWGAGIGNAVRIPDSNMPASRPASASV